jgi:hypothetical protein
MAEELTGRLASAFYFTPADLTANSHGQISDNQLRMLTLRRRMLWLGYSSFVAAMAGSAWFVYWINGRTDASVQINSSGGTEIIGIISIFVVLSFTPYFIRRLHALNPGGIKTAIGRAEVGENSSYLRVSIGSDAVFLFPKAEPYLSAFNPGNGYLIYYLPGPEPLVLSGRAELEEPEFSPPQDHPGKQLSHAAPLVVVLLLAASFGIPILLLKLREIGQTYSVLGAWLGTVLLGIGLGIVTIYLVIVSRLLSDCRKT